MSSRWSGANLATRIGDLEMPTSEPRTLRLPLRTYSEANARGLTRGAAIPKTKRVKEHRLYTLYTLADSFGPPPGLPLAVQLTRIAPRALDDDNVPPALKAIRDGVADWLAGAYRKGQDRQNGLIWRYAQRREDSLCYAVEIVLEEGKGLGQ